MSRDSVHTRWAALWRSKNQLDGLNEHLLFEDCLPKLFRTRLESRQWIEEKYGYIRNRADLMAAPHGWKMPIAIRVEIRALLGDKRKAE